MTPHHLSHVYFLLSLKDDRLYIGVTSNLRRRLMQHEAGLNRSTQYRRPFRLVYVESHLSRKDATERERRLKQFKKGYHDVKKRIVGSLETARGGGG